MNVHKLNQDDVLGGDPELSPNEFSSNVETDEPSNVRKKKSWLPLFGGIVIAMGIIGFFGWKIAAPYFGLGSSLSSSTGNANAFTPIATPKPFTSPEGNQTEEVGATGPDQQNGQASGIAQGINLPEISSKPQASQTSGIQAPQMMDRPGQALNLTKEDLARPTKMPPSDKVTTPAGASAEDIVHINKRIDDLAAALSELKDAVTKLQQLPKSTSVSHVAPVAKKTVSQNVAMPAVPKHKPFVVVKKPTAPIAVVKDEKIEKPQSQDMTASGMQLQAVLQDRAWFKTSTGVTITVSPGEELKGVGTVQQIDADSGRVIFTNGQVYR